MSSTASRARRQKTSKRRYNVQRNDIANTTSTTSERKKDIPTRVCWQMKQMPPFLLLLKRTPLIDLLINENWWAALQRLKLHPSEAKTWVELESNLVGTSPIDQPQVSSSQHQTSSNNNAFNSSVEAATENIEGAVTSGRFQNLTTPTQEPRQQPTQFEGREHKSLGPDLNEFSSRLLPLHVAARCGAPLRVIEALFNANPKAATKTDSYYDRYPLHFACLHKPNEEVVSFLLSKKCGATRAIFHRDKLYRLPLHYAAFGCANAMVFEKLLNAYPDAPKLPELHGWLPLHIAIKTGCELPVLRSLVELYPLSLKVKTKRNSTVFQLARRFHGRESIIEFQLNALNAVVEAFYDTDRNRLSLMHLSDSLWINTQHQRDISTFESDVSAIPAGDVREDSPTIVVTADLRDSSSDNTICATTVENTSDSNNRHVIVCKEECFWTAQDKIGPKVEECDSNKLCVVCLEEESAYAFVPCGHLCVCRECSIFSHRPGGMKCPICRKKSFMLMKVFQG